MSFWSLHYDIYHLGVYLAAVLLWLFLCLLLVFNSHLLLRQKARLFGGFSMALGVAVGIGLLFMDVLLFFDRGGMLVALLAVGVGLPALGIWRILRLPAAR